MAPYFTLMAEDAPQRDYSLREVFNELRWLMPARASRRMIPHDLPPSWWVVYQEPGAGPKQGWLKPWLRTYARLTNKTATKCSN